MMSTHRDLKSFYPEEEIIDGFSILCFDKYKSLEMFSNSKKVDIRNSAFNNTLKSKIISPNVLKQNSMEIKKITKVKSEHKAILIPTRITAQRKSKPDISILSLSSCKQKRQSHIQLPVKSRENGHQCSVDLKVNKNIPENHIKSAIQEDSSTNCPPHDDLGYGLIESEIADENNDVNCKLKNPNEVCVKYEILQKTECSNNSQKDDSFTEENSITTNSTLSPVSIQPIHLMQFEGESLDLNSPEKIDFEQEEVNKVVNECQILDDYNNNYCEEKNPKQLHITITTDENQGNDQNSFENNEKLNVKAMPTEEDDDCVIISVEFDPAPKLIHIPVSSYFLDVPELKPAPSVIFNLTSMPISLKSIVLPSLVVNIKPPPLIPAPARYFSLLQQEHDNNNNNYNNSFYKNCKISPKHRSRKRSQMKSSILTPPSKCMKISSNSSVAIKNCKPQLSTRIVSSTAISLKENNSTSVGNSYSLPNYTFRQTPSMPILKTASSIFYPKSTSCSTINNDIKIPKYVTSNKIHPKSSVKPLMGTSQFLVRKTVCHVHIAQSIRRKLSAEHFVDTYLQQNSCLMRPRPLRPIAQLFHQYQTFSPINVPETINSFSSANETYLNRSFGRFNYPKKSMQTFNSFKSRNDIPVLIKPLHRPLIPNTFNSTFQNSINLFPLSNEHFLKP